jgi:hypothetical protein
VIIGASRFSGAWAKIENMPVKSPPRQRPFIRMLLAELEDGAWKTAVPDWLEERMDSAVEVLATRPDGASVAIEHTIVQPFVDEKKDSNTFMQAFGRIERNPDLVASERDMTVVIPVAAIAVGYKWDEVGADLLAWLKANHHLAPIEGESQHIVQVGASTKLGPLSLDIKLQTMHLPGSPGVTVISRGPMPKNLGAIVEKALVDKLPKLVSTPASKRILLIERQHASLADTQIIQEIEKLAPSFPQLKDVHEIWIVDTSNLESEGWAYFRHFVGRGIVETMAFEHGVLKRRHEHGAVGAKG